MIDPYRGSRFVRHKACEHRICDIANSDFPTVKGDHCRSTVGKKIPDGELEEH
jgi:hypothetical protein